MFLLFLIVVVSFALYVMTPGERGRLLQTGLTAVGHAKQAASRAAAPDPFKDALVARTRLPLATFSIVALNVLVFFAMLFGGGTRDQQALVEWGANFGPRTTNGEWWRLITALFVHAGFFHLILNAAGFVQLGLVIERLVGHFAFAVVYLSAGIFAGLADLSGDPIAIAAGGSGAILGVYGLLITSLIWSFVTRRTAIVPLRVLKTLAPGAALFALYLLLTGGINSSALCGLIVGLVYGMVLTKDALAFKPPVRLVAAAAAATIVIGAVAAFTVRGVADVRPELERIVAIEDRTATIYQKAVAQFRLGAMSAKSLAQVIDRTIVPEVQAALERLKNIKGVPSQHESLVASAEEYLRLRGESWRIRSDALHNGNMPALLKADRAEWASLEALERIKAQP